MKSSLSRSTLPAAAGILFLGASIMLCACQPPHKAPRSAQAEADAAMEAKGFTHAPAISAVAAGAERGFVGISGTAPADSRVRLVFSDPLKGGQAVGVTADAQGQFHAEVPITANGGLYDLSVDDGGRVRSAESRLFVPPGAPDKAMLLRPGLVSRLLQPGAMGVMAVDYDAAGAFAVSGRVAPDTAVDVIVNGEIRAQVRSDAQGMFEAATQVPKPETAPQPVSIIVQAGKASYTRDVQVVAVAAGGGDKVTEEPTDWRIDWHLPGQGNQSTIVFKN
jgi:hypothetical protein